MIIIIITFHLLLRVKQEIHSSLKSMTRFLSFVFQLIGLANLFKRPTESWHKVSKNFGKIKNLASSKSSLHASLNKCRRRFKLLVNLLDAIHQGRNSNRIFITQMLALAYSAWVCCVVKITLFFIYSISFIPFSRQLHKNVTILKNNKSINNNNDNN